MATCTLSVAPSPLHSFSAQMVSLPVQSSVLASLPSSSCSGHTSSISFQSTWPFPAQASVKFFFWNLFCGSAHGWLLAILSLLRLALVYLKWSALPLCCVTLPVLQLPLLCSLYPPSSPLISSAWAALLADSGVHEM